MNFEKLMKQAAAEYNTTCEEVETEIRKAIRAAGYDMEPEIFIALAAAKVNDEMNKKRD
ncbi:MAG: hypothetical protein IJU45_07805 [Clostridia bacterium]|nr:hypothetical protein [Clostridia bacterium]